MSQADLLGTAKVAGRTGPREPSAAGEVSALYRFEWVAPATVCATRHGFPNSP